MNDDRRSATWIVRDRVKWLPAYVYEASGEKELDDFVKHDIQVESNFVDGRQIAWTFIRQICGSQVFEEYGRRIVL